MNNTRNKQKAIEGKNRKRSPIVLPIKIKKLDTMENDIIKKKKLKASLFFDFNLNKEIIPIVNNDNTISITINSKR